MITSLYAHRSTTLSCLLFAMLATNSHGLATAQSGTKTASKAHPLKKAIELTEQSLAKMRQVKSYQADLTKKEVIGRRAVEHKIKLKIREQPFSVYMYYVDPSKGREVLYIEGQNDGNLLAHDVGLKGLVGTIALKPTGSMAMEDNRYPITKIGIVRSVEEVVAQWKKELKYSETEVKYYPNAKMDQLACRVIESTHPTPRKGFKFKKTRLWFDAKTNLPVRIEQFGFPKNPKAKAPLVEQYTYRNLKVNLQLTDRDFDKTNPRYNF
jgi:outer membrane lipoprotein-sorting protein